MLQGINQRITAAVGRAQDAFWAEIAKAFPEIKTGDFPPDASFAIEAAMLEAARVWVNGNLPPIDEASESQLQVRPVPK